MLFLLIVILLREVGTLDTCFGIVIIALSSGIFVLKTSLRHVIFLIGWLGVHMNLRLVVLILTSHALVSQIMPLLCVNFFIVLIMTTILIPIIFLMMALLDLIV